MDTGHVLIELGGVLLVLAVLGRLAERFSVPSVPLFLVAGLVMGEGGVVPLEASTEFIEVGASLGVILLLLTLGLEYTPEELHDGLRSNSRAGLVDLVANALPGAAAGLLLGWDPLAVLLLAGATYISSSGIIAKLLSDLGRIGNRETPVVLSILVLEDLAMALYLPVVAALLIGGHPLDGAMSVLLALSIVTLVLVLSPRLARWVTRLVATESSEMLVLTMLGLTLLVAGLAEEIQVSAGVGAFLVGIVLSGPVVEKGRPVLEPLRDVFAAIFFVFFGLQIDPSSLVGVALPAVALALVTAGTKMGTGWWAARRAGIAVRGRMRAAVALVPRGEFSIVIAGLGVSAGVEDDLGPLVAGYVLVLAVAGALAIRYADALPVPAAARPSLRRP